MHIKIEPILITPSAISVETVTAYEQTHYRVLGDEPMTLHIGRQSAELATLHRAERVTCSAYITACNPWSEFVDDRINATRQSQLARELRHRGLVYRDGVGESPSGSWPGEASFLVLGLSLEATKVLGKRLNQNAVVWTGPDAVPTLVLLR